MYNIHCILKLTGAKKYIWEFLDKLISGQRCFFVLKTNRKNDEIIPFCHRNMELEKKTVVSL